MIDTTKTIREVRYNGTAIPLLGGVDNPVVVTSDAEMEACLNDDRYLGMYVKFSGESENYLNGQVYKIAQEEEVSKFYQLPTLDNEGTAADLVKGKQLISSGGKLVTGTADSSIGTGDFWVKVIDYDGTVLLEKRGNNGDSFDLPSAPSHDGLVFQEWSASQAIIDNKITIANNNIMVGAVYTTASDQNEFDITLTKVTGLKVTLYMDGTKDWGDGTSDTKTTHTYTVYGNYTIKCNGTKMTIPSGGGLFGQSSSGSNYYCTAVRIATVTSINAYAFRSCSSLTSIVIPNGVTSIHSNAFYRCFSLTSIIIPDSVTSIDVNAFISCYSLTSIVMPNGVTSIGYSMFSACSALISIVIPNGVTSMGDSAFADCSSLTNIVIPNSVTSIGTTAFLSCYSLIKYDFSQSIAVPMLSNTNAFTNINKIAKIIVPDSLYDEWIAATNWSTYANYIYKASEVNNE